MTAPNVSRLRVLLVAANTAGALASLGLASACSPRIDADASHATRPSAAVSPAPVSAPVASSGAAASAQPSEAPKPAAPRAAALSPAAPRPASWLGVTASRGQRGTLAAWSEKTVAISTDGGVSFHTVFASRAHVDAAALDAAGALFVVRSQKDLSVRAPDGRVTHHALAFAKKTTSIATGAGTLAWLGTRVDDGAELPAIAISKDDGATWTLSSPAEMGNAANAIAVDDDGTLRVMSDTEADCGGGYQTRFVGSEGGETWKEAAWPLDAPGAWAIGAHGWAYAIGDCGDGEQGHLCAVDADGHASAVAPVENATFKDLHAMTSGGVTWATIEGTLARLDGATVTFPAAPTPKDFAITGIDADGQPVGAAHGRAMRLSHDGKWQPIFHASVPAPQA